LCFVRSLAFLFQFGVFAVSFKQAIVLRSDLGMGKGKLVAQGSHASVAAFQKCVEKGGPTERDALQWSEQGSEKIVLKVPGERELRLVFAAAVKRKLQAVLIIDAGHTQVPAGSPTAVAIGPAEEKEIDAVTGELKLL